MLYKVIKNVIFWLATILVAVAIIFVSLPLIGGYDYKHIVSASMEPDIPVGSLIVIEEIADEDIRIGDVITYSISGDRTVTHKVVGYDLSRNALITHGINNAEGVNEITPYEAVVGKVVFTVPVLGRIFSFIGSERGKVLAATCIILLYIASVFFETLGTPAENEEDTEEGTNQDGVKTKRKFNLPSLWRNKEVGIQSGFVTLEVPQGLGSWLDDML